MTLNKPPMTSLKTYLIETGNHTWAGRGSNMNEGVKNAFKQIRDDCHSKPNQYNIGLTFSVRRENEPRSKSITGGCTISMLVAIGEITERDVRHILRRFQSDRE